MRRLDTAWLRCVGLGGATGGGLGLLLLYNLVALQADVPLSTMLLLSLVYLCAGIVLGALCALGAQRYPRAATSLVLMGPAAAYAALFVSSPLRTAFGELGRAGGWAVMALAIWHTCRRHHRLLESADHDPVRPALPSAVFLAILLPLFGILITTRFVWYLENSPQRAIAIALVLSYAGWFALVLEADRRLRRKAGNSSRRAWGGVFGALLVVIVLPPVIPETLFTRSEVEAVPRLAAGGQRAGPPIILISLDTVRRDRVSVYSPELATTPSLETFGKDALIFTNAISTSPWTLPSHASLFTGLHPSEQGGEASEEHAGGYRLPASVLTLAERLRAAGYRTGGVVANGGYLNPYFGFNRGFERYFHAPAIIRCDPLVYLFLLRMGMVDHPWLQRLGLNLVRLSPDIIRQARKWLDSVADSPHESAAQPPFLFLNFMEAHLVEYLPFPGGGQWSKAFYLRDGRHEALRDGCIRGVSPFPEEERERVLEWYDAEIRFLDLHLGYFFDALRRAGLYEESLIVVWSDHGEMMAEHGAFGHRNDLYEELLRVPLLVKLPDSWPLRPHERVGVVDTYVQSTDLFRFLLAAGTGGELPAGEDSSHALAHLIGDGSDRIPRMGRTNRSILAAAEVDRYPRDARRYPAHFDRDLRAIYGGPDGASMKLIRGTDHSLKLFDLEADPGERRNVAELDTLRLPLMDRLMEAWVGTLVPVEDSPVAGGKEDLRSLLRSLGYIN